MTVATSCSSCGSPAGTADRFCGVCGADLHAASGKAQAGAPAQAAAEAPRRVPAKTMLGMTSPFATGAGANASAPVATAPQAQPAAAASGQLPGGHKKTMLGLSPLAAAGNNAPAGTAVVEAGQAPGRLLTKAAPVETAPAAPVHAGSPASAKASPVSNRTMLGVAPAGLAAAVQTAASAAQPKESPYSEPQAAQVGNPLIDGRKRSFTPVSESAVDAGTSAPVALAPLAPRRLGLYVALAFAVGLLVAAAALLLRGQSAPLSLRVVRTETGDALEVEVPGSAPGSKVRFAGSERPLSAGRASFPLSADSLGLGENRLAIDVVGPRGEVDTAEVKLLVDYRVRMDVTALAAETPAVELVVDALPNSTVTVDGAVLALDGRGHAVKSYPIPPQTGQRFELRSKYHIGLAGGAPVDGVAELSLPVTGMQIDRPGADVVTDQTLIEIAGAVEPGAQVMIENRAIEVRDGRFRHQAQLPQPGDYVLHVSARSPNKVPRLTEIRLRRVTDMTVAAASFKADPTITYAKLMQNASHYRGQKVAFDGRVYNVEVREGRSVLQLLALNCPSSARCPLWVDYPQATEATVDSWVRVLGTASGEQQFRSKQGKVETVPSVQAQYVLKLAR